MKVCLYRKAHFNAAHRLFCKEWSEEKNKEVFGKCFNPHYHGHNYEITIGITGEIDPQTGYVMNLEELKKIIQEEIIEYLDHKNLNEEIIEFQELNPTVENICVLIYNRIRPKISEEKELKVIVYETPRNFAEYSGQ